MSGKRGKAPCGHEGEHVIGQYVACKLCDGKGRHAPATLLVCEGTDASSGLHDYTIKAYDPMNFGTVWICKTCGLECML